MNTKKRKVALIIAIIVILIIAFPMIKKEVAYQEAKSYLRKRDYQTAQKCFDDLDGYRESKEFFCYIKAIRAYKSSNFSVAYVYLDEADINDNEFKDELQAFEIEFAKAYDNYMKESAQKAEKEQKEKEEREEKEIINKLPYEGMNEKYLDKTKLGKYGDYYINYKVENGKQIERQVYNWYTKEGSLIFRAVVDKSYVTSTSKFYESKYWNGDDLKNGVLPGGRKKSKTYKKQESTKFVDEYNVNDYSNEDDFYYDHYDDFYDYYEAEDYYRDHHE